MTQQHLWLRCQTQGPDLKSLFPFAKTILQTNYTMFTVPIELYSEVTQGL